MSQIENSIATARRRASSLARAIAKRRQKWDNGEGSAGGMPAHPGSVSLLLAVLGGLARRLGLST